MQQQQPMQQQQQAWEVPWQDQVRGNPQAEYAAIAQARSGAAADANFALVDLLSSSRSGDSATPSISNVSM